jgi:hypothetical protein
VSDHFKDYFFLSMPADDTPSTDAGDSPEGCEELMHFLNLRLLDPGHGEVTSTT